MVAATSGCKCGWETSYDPTDILGIPSMGRAMDPWHKLMITRMNGGTNGWALDTLQIVGVQRISWLV